MFLARSMFSLAVVLAATPALAVDGSVTYVSPGGQRGWFICDALDTKSVLVRRDAAGGQVTIGVIRKTVPKAPAISTYALGRADPGAGQVHYALSADGHEVGNIHASNPDAYDAAAVRTPPVTSVQIGETGHQCRWLANTRMIGVAAGRSFVVREIAPGRLLYESFDYARPPGPILHPDGVQRTTRPTQSISGGRESKDRQGGTLFRFANAGFVYVITVARDGVATLAVLQGNRVVQSERLTAFTFAPY